MHTALMSVLEFHAKMGQPIGDPRKPDLSVDTQLRWDLIHEEFNELTLALEGKDKHGNKLSHDDQIIAVADALGDIAYVVAGAAATWGIDLGGVFDAIHTSNMTKTPGNKRQDGKILKGPNYAPPDIKGALAEAKAEVEAHGFGEDAWWPTPTVSSGLPILEAEDVTDPEGFTQHMAKQAAKPHKLKKAMQELKSAPNWTEPEENESFGAHLMPAEMTEKLMGECKVPPQGWSCSRDAGHNGPCAASPNEDYSDFDESRDTEPTIPYNGQFLARGAFLFDCDCGRTHEIQTKAGSRGGLLKQGHSECMCGKVFDVTFSRHNGEEHAEFEVQDLGGIHA